MTTSKAGNEGLTAFLVIWAPFIAASITTIVASHTLWATEWYRGYLAALGVLCCLLGARVLAKTGVRRGPLAGVSFGLLVGQWWLVQALILAFFWHSNGFAP
jgi:hypothetical protein